MTREGGEEDHTEDEDQERRVDLVITWPFHRTVAIVSLNVSGKVVNGSHSILRAGQSGIASSALVSARAFGHDVSNVGDMDGNGNEDLVVGAPDEDSFG